MEPGWAGEVWAARDFSSCRQSTATPYISITGGGHKRKKLVWNVAGVKKIPTTEEWEERNTQPGEFHVLEASFVLKRLCLLVHQCKEQENTFLILFFASTFIITNHCSSCLNPMNSHILPWEKRSSIVVFDLFFIASINSALIRKWHVLCVSYFTSCLCIILTEARRHFTLRLVGGFFCICIITVMACCALVFFIPAKWRWEVNTIILQLHR